MSLLPWGLKPPAIGLEEGGLCFEGLTKDLQARAFPVLDSSPTTLSRARSDSLVGDSEFRSRYAGLARFCRQCLLAKRLSAPMQARQSELGSGQPT